MKKNILPLLLISLLFSCSETPKGAVQNDPEKTGTSTEKPKAEHIYYASYVGNFEAEEMDPNQDGSMTNLINITLTSLENGKAEGRSIIAGNDRPFTGTYKQQGSQFEIAATEPGDDKHDGRFEFKLDTTNQTVSGKWYCNDKTIAVPVRKFELSKKEFKYNPDNNLDASIVGASLYNGKEYSEEKYEAITDKVVKLNASKQKLSNKDVENLYKGDLEVIRNTIYARPGYSFRNRRMRYLFDNQVDWYVPQNVDVRSELTELEKENIALLKRYEQHAEKYYDEFSR